MCKIKNQYHKCTVYDIAQLANTRRTHKDVDIKLYYALNYMNLANYSKLQLLEQEIKSYIKIK